MWMPDRQPRIVVGWAIGGEPSRPPRQIVNAMKWLITVGRYAWRLTHLGNALRCSSGVPAPNELVSKGNFKRLLGNLSVPMEQAA